MAKSLRPKVFLTGRVAVEANGRAADDARFSGRQGRLVFAYLVAAQSRPVPRDELAEAIWGESPPATWEKALTVIVSKLRGLLAEDGIGLTNAFGCYRLDLPEGTWVDLFAAASDAANAEDALGAGDNARAKKEAASAESVARRAFLPGEEGVWVDDRRRELADVRERALGILVDACLRSGEAQEAAKWAEQAIALSPFRETGYRRLMEAHAAAGNRAEALRVYEQCRHLLAEELGAYPSPATESMYRALLEAPQTSVRTTPVAEPVVERAEPELSPAQTGAQPLAAEQVVGPRSRKRLVVLLSVLTAAITAAVVVPLVVFDRGGSGGGSLVPATDDSLGVVNARSGRLVANVGVGATPTAVAVGDGSYWVTNAGSNTVTQVDPGTNGVVDSVQVGNGPTGIAFGDGALWVVNSLDGRVSRVDPGTRTVVDTIGVGGEPLGIVYAAGSVWVANTATGTITKIDPGSDTPTTLPVAATGLAFGAGTLWASESAAGQVVRIDPATGKQVFAIRVGNGPTGIAFGDGAAWVANSLDGTVSRIDPDTNSVDGLVLTGNGPDAVAVDARGVWVSDQFDGQVARIDPGTNRVAQRVNVGSFSLGLAMSGDAVLVAVRHAGAGHSGGTLVLRAENHKGVVDSIDHATSTSAIVSPLLAMTGDGLTALDQVSGPDGVQLVPDLAYSLPAPIDGGKTYTFLLRPGIRYSNGRLLQATDFRSTVERDYALGSGGDYDEILGGAQCHKYPKRCDLSRGIVANNAARTVTFHLVRPDPDFLYKLTYVYVLPAGTPWRPAGTHPLPATGPYMIATYKPGRLLRFVRNPYFHAWNSAAQPAGYPDRIDLRIAGTVDQATRAVVDGKADVLWLAQPFTPKQLSRIEVQYRSQLYSDPSPNLQAFFLNTRVPPFNRLDARKAISFAVDRAAALNAWGGPNVAQVTCQILPTGYPGYRPYCPYTAGSTRSGKWTAPDLTKAKALVARSGTRGMKVTLWAWSEANGGLPPDKTGGFNLVALKALDALGYRVTVKPVGDEEAFAGTALGGVDDSRNRAQIGFSGWSGGYPAPASFFVPLFSCSAFVPASPDNFNVSEFCDPRIDRQMVRAQAEQQSDPIASRALWQRVDREVTDAAPWVPLMLSNWVEVLSKRVGNYQYSPGAGPLIDQLWVR